MNRQVRFIVEACLWRDKINGNTYHACRITRTDTGDQLHCPWQYGYGSQYRTTALDRLVKAEWLPRVYQGEHARYCYERECGYPIYWIERFTTKREMVAFGKAPEA